MPLEAPLSVLDAKVAGLNDRYRHHSATAVLERALKDPDVGNLAARVVLRGGIGRAAAPCLGRRARHAGSVHRYADAVPRNAGLSAGAGDRKLDLTDIRTIRAAHSDLKFEDPDDTLHQFSTDSCCNLRKVVPLERALKGFDGWITGRKRFQGDTRATIDFFENEADLRIKVNPLAHWGREDIEDYIVNNRLPRHPLVAKGYPSIGCAPCTSPVKPGEDPRAGRWRGSAKVECGIHFIDGKAVRVTAEAAE